MRYINRLAFSLTELLIVLVIISVLFAAMAPIVTKRRVASGDWAQESVWNYVTGDSYMDAYFNPGVDSWSSIAFIGLDPDLSGITNEDKTSGGKVTIRANDSVSSPQRQIQFRYGEDFGMHAGSLFVDDNYNIMLGSGFDNNIDNSRGGSNTILGLNTTGELKSGTLEDSTIVGSFSLFNPKNLKGGNNTNITAIGANSARDFGANVEEPDVAQNVFVGANSGRTEKISSFNVGVGYNSLSSPFMTGGKNVAVGAETGSSLSSGEYNVFGASKFAATTGSYNTILGYGVYEARNPEVNALTAVGYGACGSIYGSALSAPKTCIGYSSGQKINGSLSDFGAVNDEQERIFIGGIPAGSNRYAGRSVLEIHNIDRDNGINASVVLNSNLVLRGNLYTSRMRNKDLAFDNFDVITDYRHTSISRNFTEGMPCSRDTRNPLHRRYMCTGWSSKSSNSSNNMFKRDSDLMPFSYLYNNSDYNYPKLSDIRLKENLSVSAVGLDDILKIQSYNYTFKTDNNKSPHVGIIAQDLKDIFLNAVQTAQDGYYRIRLDDMFFAMINAIKTLAVKVEKLALEITGLDTDIDYIFNRNNVLKKQIADLNSRAAKLERK